MYKFYILVVLLDVGSSCLYYSCDLIVVTSCIVVVSTSCMY